MLRRIVVALAMTLGLTGGLVGTAVSANAVCSPSQWCTVDNSYREWPLFYGFTEVATAFTSVQRKVDNGQLYHRAYTRVHNNCWTNSCGNVGEIITKSVQAGSSDTSDRIRLGSTYGGPALAVAVPDNADATAGGGLDAVTWTTAEPMLDGPCCVYASFTTGQASARLLTGQLVTLHTRSNNTDNAYYPLEP